MNGLFLWPPTLLVLTRAGCHVTIPLTQHVDACVAGGLLTLEPGIVLPPLACSRHWHLTGPDYCFYSHDLVFTFQSAISSLQMREQTRTQAHADRQTHTKSLIPQTAQYTHVVWYLNPYRQHVLSRGLDKLVLLENYVKVLYWVRLRCLLVRFTLVSRKGTSICLLLACFTGDKKKKKTEWILNKEKLRAAKVILP